MDLVDVVNPLALDRLKSVSATVRKKKRVKASMFLHLRVPSLLFDLLEPLVPRG